jgi:hypothetical protein
MLASVLEWRGIGKMDKVILKRSEENMKKQVMRQQGMSSAR